MKIWTSNIRFVKNINFQPRSETWNNDVAGTSPSIKDVTETSSRHVLGWCHINFIISKTYSALLPPKAYDSPRLWNEFMGVSKHFPQSIFRYYDAFMTHNFTTLCGLNPYIFLPWFFSRLLKYNYLHFEIPTTAKRTFEQIHYNSTKPKHLPLLSIKKWRNFSTTCIICDHRCPNQLLALMVTRVYDSSSEITGISTVPRWKFNGFLETRSSGAISDCEGVICSRLGSVDVRCMW
jgi:hypothetical protein